VKAHLKIQLPNFAEVISTPPQAKNEEAAVGLRPKASTVSYPLEHTPKVEIQVLNKSAPQWVDSVRAPAAAKIDLAAKSLSQVKAKAEIESMIEGMATP
jgi:hypothetical protein